MDLWPDLCQVERVKLPVEGNADCKVYVKWREAGAAEKAYMSLKGRLFDGRQVDVEPLDDSVFDALPDAA